MIKIQAFAIVLLAAGVAASAAAQTADDSLQTGPASDATEVRGVNPADILNRADLIVKFVNLPDGEALTGILKFDKKLGAGLGANFELPVLSYVNPGPVSAFGVGDLFSRVRYVKALSPKVIALGSLEMVVPLASDPLLGAGKWQLNPGGGLVYLWSRRAFGALIYKHSFSIAGDSARSAIDVNQARVLQTFILDRGWYVTLDAKHEWQTRGFDEQWTTTEFEVGRQFSARLAGSLRVGKAYGDRPNDGTLEFNIRTFF